MQFPQKHSFRISLRPPDPRASHNVFFDMVCDEGGPDGGAVHFAFVDGGLEADGAGYGVLVDA